MNHSFDWLIADTHWYHDMMVESQERPQNHTELSIENLRTLMKPNDRLIHLGDVIFYKNHLLKEILDSINGTKFLIVGNHDNKSKGWYYRNGFSFVSDMIVLGDVLYSHRPIQNFPDKVKLNVHGHIHIPTEKKMLKYPWWSNDTHKLFCLEQTNYRPIRVVDFVK